MVKSVGKKKRDHLRKGKASGRVMKPKSSGVHETEFLEIAMRILVEEREFLEKIGRL